MAHRLQQLQLQLSRLALLTIFLLSVSPSPSAQEFRALWVDTFHQGIKTPAQVTQLVNDARAGNFNAVIVEVRKRGDAYYRSNFEPLADDVSNTFDPLADLIAKAHNTNNGPRIEVHAWIVTYNIWNQFSALPPQPTHPFRLHQDWLTQNASGATWDGNNYAFDPGHPEVQRHTFNVALDIVTNYPVDGLNFDYIRYAGNNWGFNPVTVDRFNQLFDRTGQPETLDADWMQFRRDQVTALVRKVYLNVMAVKPGVKVSADTITWAPGPASPGDWMQTAAYRSVLQDWRAWLEEGIIDLNIPMTYFRQHTHPADWAKWNTFIKDHKYGRHAAIGVGAYLNGLSNVLHQFAYTRTPTALSNVADGLAAYSYFAADSNITFSARLNLYAALTTSNAARLYQTNPEPLFLNRATPPLMPWKTDPTTGHLKGFITDLVGNFLDGATVTLNGPVIRTQRTDATGFYGFTRLPPGTYWVTATPLPVSTERGRVNVLVQSGQVTTADITTVEPPRITQQPVSLTVTQGSTARFSVTATGDLLTYNWRLEGQPFPGATNRDFTITNAQYLHDGRYTVLVSNAAAAVLSAPADLILHPARLAEFSAVQLVSSNGVQLTVLGATGFPYRVEASTNLSVWTPLTTVTNSPQEFPVFDGPLTNAQRFYRTRLNTP